MMLDKFIAYHDSPSTLDKRAKPVTEKDNRELI